MVYVELLYNLALLVAITIVSGFIESRGSDHARFGLLLQGVLFGSAAVLGMLRPLDLGSGLIFDGRSIMISLCAFFFGPLAAAVAAAMAAACRLWLGGIGMMPGLLTIFSSAGIGLLAHWRLDPTVEPPSAKTLYLFGVAVHVTILACLWTLPQGAGPDVIKRIGPAVILMFPLATVLAGKILSDQVSAARIMEDLKQTKQNLAITLKSIGDAVITTNLKGEITFMNPAAETLIGCHWGQTCGKGVDEVLNIVDERNRESAGNLINHLLKTGELAPPATPSLLIAKDETEKSISYSAAPIHDACGKISGAVLVLHDQTDQYRVQRLMQARITLLEYAANHSLADILAKALDEAGKLVESPIGFCHFVAADQKTLHLQQWSTRTKRDFCQAKGEGMHYSIDQAGVWVDCVRQKRAVVHNDYASLPHKKGFPKGHVEVVRELVVPIIRDGRTVAIFGVGNKPTDYTEKDVDAVSHLADMVWQITEKKRTDVELQKSELKYRDLFENAPIGIFNTTSQGKTLSVNAAAARMLGFNSPQETVEHYMNLQEQLYIDPRQRDRFLQLLQERGRVENFECQVCTFDGRNVLLSVNARIARRNDDGGFIIEAFTTDITEQRKLEEQYHQAQKMESVGRLAGGVAHDYNNMLSVILGYTELALNRVNPSDPLYQDLLEIQNAARRSSTITRQLLAFARKQTISPKPVDLNDTIEGMLKMLQRLIGEDINLEWRPGTDLWPVNMDSAQVDQILANLIVNARDAIAGVGKITIWTEKAILEPDHCTGYGDCIPGEYVLLAVSDNGCGMDQQTIENIFEPFYTTKAAGQGTGLGLPTVYGIVKQNNGFIKVLSKPGEGTTFELYLPRHYEPAQDAMKDHPPEILSGQGEMVLLVEDEKSILELCHMMLENLGYKVLPANTPQEALRQAEIYWNGKIHLLITDIIMPEMNGGELAGVLQSFYPHLKCLFMSGYTADVIAQKGMLDKDVNFIQKPFTLQELAARVSSILNQGQQKNQAGECKP